MGGEGEALSSIEGHDYLIAAERYAARALLEFPPPQRLLKGLQRGRLQINDAIVTRGIRAALLAGWEPASCGKPMVFVVDADGN